MGIQCHLAMISSLLSLALTLAKSSTSVSSSARSSCWANSCGKGRRSNAIFIIKHGFNTGHTSKTPRTRQARFCAISLWHRRCLAVGQGKRFMREHKSANCGFKFSQRASISASVFRDFKFLNCVIRSEKNAIIECIENFNYSVNSNSPFH